MTVLKTHHIGENLVPSYIKSVEILSDGVSVSRIQVKNHQFLTISISSISHFAPPNFSTMKST